MHTLNKVCGSVTKSDQVVILFLEVMDVVLTWPICVVNFANRALTNRLKKLYLSNGTGHAGHAASNRSFCRVTLYYGCGWSVCGYV